MDEILLLKTKSVLYVEDDDVVRESVGNTLQYFFNDITIAKDGKEAMELLERRFDVVILDHNLPFYNGIDIARHIRTKTDETIIFMISNYQETKLLRDAMSIGAIDYLPKPLSFDEFRNALKECAKRLEKKELVPLVDGYFYNKTLKSIFKNGIETKLTKNETIFLELLVENPNQIISYELISEELFKSQNSEANLSSIKNMILRLRRKLDTQFVENVTGLGYRFV